MYMFLANISARIRFLSLYRIYISVHLLITSGALLQAENPPLLPELANKYQNIINDDIMHELTMEKMWLYNRETIYKILKLDSEATRNELRRRLADDNTPADVRILYAGILASLNDQTGQTYLMNKGRSETKLLDAKNVFWMISNLDWLYPREDNKSVSVNMKWAENFMLEMLKEPKTFKVKSFPQGYSRQSLAINSFGEILAKMKSQELYPVLVALWNANPPQVEKCEIFSIFAKLGDKRAVPILLEYFEFQSMNAESIQELMYVGYVLAKMGVKEAIPILLKHLNSPFTYPVLSEYNDERILPALKNALPELKGDAKAEACLMIINLEGGDRLPKLIELAQNPNFDNIQPMYIIRGLKDERAVPFAIKELNSSPDLYRRFAALHILSAIRNSPAAIKGLIDALDIDVNAIAEGKDVMNDNNKEFRTAITYNLKRMTGQDFGENKQKWLEYYRNTYKLKK